MYCCFFKYHHFLFIFALLAWDSESQASESDWLSSNHITVLNCQVVESRKIFSFYVCAKTQFPKLEREWKFRLAVKKMFHIDRKPTEEVVSFTLCWSDPQPFHSCYYNCIIEVWGHIQFFLWLSKLFTQLKLSVKWNYSLFYMCHVLLRPTSSAWYFTCTVSYWIKG